MKRSIRFGKLLLALPLLAAAVAFRAGPAQAATLYYWDMNGIRLGASDGDTMPSGVWNQGDLCWNRDPNGTDEYGGCIAGYNTSYNFVFSAGNHAKGNYAIEVSGTRDAKSITVKDGTPTFSGGKLSFFAGTGSIDTTTCNPLFNVVIGGSVGLTKSGSGTLTLTGANDYTGLTAVSVGVLNIRNNNALGFGDGSAGNNTTVSNGAALELQSTNSIVVGNEALSLNGTGISMGVVQGGALRNISGANTYGGLITLAGPTRINSDSGTLTLDVTSGIAITGTQTLTFGGAGNITVADPIATSTSTLTKDGAGTLTLSGANTYTGNTVIADGTLTLADNARLTFVIPATTPNGNNTLTGAGTAVLDGDFYINTTLSDASLLTSGTWQIENVPSLTGAYGSTFQVVDSTSTPWTDAGSDKWTRTVGDTKRYSFDETTGILTLSPPHVPGDANEDGYVDALDYVRVSNNYETGSTWIQGDVTGDGIVNALDYVEISNHYGEGVLPLGISASPVPEPGTLILLAAGLLGLVCYAWRRRRS